MRRIGGLQRLAAAVVASGFAVVAGGCGQLSIESWVIALPTSTGSVTVSGIGVETLSPLEGGFLGLITVDTRQLPAPLNGTITLEDIRLAAGSTNLLNVCVWGNPAGSSTGTVTLDILGGKSSANLTLDVLATTGLSQRIHFPPAELKEPLNLSLGSGLSIQTLLAASNSGSADGLFTTSATFQGNSTIGPFAVTFDLNLNVTNQSAPPTFSDISDTGISCGPFFKQQTLVPGLFYGLNSKSSYLLAANGDNPAAPLAIALADVGAAPGNTLHLTRIGTFADATQLKNGGQTKVSGVFSSTNVVLASNVQPRVPGAIQSGAPAFVTPPTISGFFIKATDIPQDFLIDPAVDVVVPAGAAYLIVAPFSPDGTWGDNSGFSLGVAVEVH